MERKITFRLRPGRDDDLAEALEAACKELDKSDIARAALRNYLGLSSVFLPTQQKQEPINNEIFGDIEIQGTEKEEDMDSKLDDLFSDL